MNITEEDILKVFQDSDEEEISCNGVGEEKDLCLFDEIDPTDFLQISMVIHEKPEGSKGDSRSRSNHKTDKKYQKTFQNRCRRFICEHCGEGFYRLPTLRAHKNNLHWLESYTERQDQKIAMPMPIRDNFSRSETKSSPSPSFVNKPFSCKFCGKKFLQLRQMDF